MRPLQQIGTVTAISFRSLHTRVKSSLFIVVGVGFMVFVLLSFLSIVEGLKLAALGAGDPDRAIIYAKSDIRRPLIEEKNVNIVFSDRAMLPPGTAGIVGDAPGVARAAGGIKLVDTQVSLNISGLTKRNNSEAGYTYLLGFSSLDGGTVDFAGVRWRIVGIFVTGDIPDGYLIGDAQTLMSAINHPIDTVVMARLTSPNKFEAFRQALKNRLPQNVSVERETDHYANYWTRAADSSPAIFITFIVAALIGSGMVSGTMHTMQVAIEERAREIAILRAIGYRGVAVAASVVLEAMLLATLGGLIGTTLVWLWLNDFLYNGGPGVFAVRVDLHMLLTGLEWALVVALIGALFPAIRASRQTVIESLKEI
jgi:putative ABC transport system permease protein